MADRASGCRNSTRGIVHTVMKARRLGGNQVGQVKSEHRRGAGQDRHLAAVDSGGEDQDVASALRKRPHAFGVHTGHAGHGGERRVRWQVSQVLAVPDQFQKRERVSAGFPMEAVGQVLAQRLFCHAGHGGERRVRWQVSQVLAVPDQFQKRERVSAGFPMEAVGQVLAQRLFCPVLEKLRGRRPVQPGYPQGRQVGAVEQ